MDFEKLKSFMDKLCSWRIPGNACSVYKDGMQIFKYASGYADVEAKIPMTGTDERLFVYSASKIITCTAALMEWEKGSFLLDDALDTYMPEWKNVMVRKTGGDGTEYTEPCKGYVKVRDLFSMSAGLDYSTERPSIAKALSDLAPSCPTRKICAAMAGDPLLFEPGTHWNYSFCHDVLAALVEVVSGMRMRDYAKKYIFDPLGMNNTSYGMGDSPLRMAKIYQFSDEEGRYSELPGQNNYYIFGPEYDSGGAGVVSTVEDMAVFMHTLALGGTSANGVKILSPSTVALMKENTLDPVALKDFNWSPLCGYGYGLGVRTLISKAAGGSPSPLGEFGWTGAAGAYVLIDTENRLSMFYAHHMLNNQEWYTASRLRNILYSCL